MKRYRISSFDFDSRANILNMEIESHWDEAVKSSWKASINNIKGGVIEQFGILNSQDKIERFKEIGPKPFSIISYHNQLLSDIRNSYVLGSFYSALTGACALGERILNHLILDLREYYKPENYLKHESDIYSCKNYSNWKLMIDTLHAWKVFSEETADLFKKLSKKRHKSLHFNIKTVRNLKEESLETIKILQGIIEKQFPAFVGSYFIYVPGEAFLKKELESEPFFKEYYIPNCRLVSPFHRILQVYPVFSIEDVEVENIEIDDQKFLDLRNEFKG